MRTTKWAGLSTGDTVVVDGIKELRQSWVFVAHVTNTQTNEQWVEVRGGRSGEAKSRSFRPDMIFPSTAKKSGRVVASRSPTPLNCPFRNSGIRRLEDVVVDMSQRWL